MLNRLSYKDVFNTCGTTRWHMVRIHRQQTLAEHQYLVTMIAVKMCMQFTEFTAEDLMQVITEAMVHDIPEIEYGDIPTPSKRHLGDLDVIQEKLFWGKRGVDIDKINKSKKLVDIVSLADKIEALIFYSHEGYNETQNGKSIKDTLSESLMSHALMMEKEHGEKWTEHVLYILKDITDGAVHQEAEEEATEDTQDGGDSYNSSDIPGSV